MYALKRKRGLEKEEGCVLEEEEGTVYWRRRRGVCIGPDRTGDRLDDRRYRAFGTKVFVEETKVIWRTQGARFVWIIKRAGA